MRRLLTLIACAVLLGLVALWWQGGFDRLALWAAQQQREFQNAIAAALRAARASQPGAVAALLSACFAYGLAHAAGPGHGKVLIGGYGLARRVPMLRLSAIALISSLGQAVTAVALVYAGVGLLSAGREAMVGATEDFLAPASYAAIALIGGWLVWRGAKRLGGQKRDAAAEDHAVCADCGHRHGPSLAEVDRAATWREAAILIGGIAIRPCTGALFVLIITWQMGIGPLGIAGAFAMALGTGLFTIAVGLGAGMLRGGMLAGVARSPRAAMVAATVEVLAGAAVLILATELLRRAL